MINFKKIKTYSIKERKNLVSVKDFSKIDDESLFPDIYAGKAFKNVVKAIREAKKNDKKVIWMMGAHVIKCGLSPWIIELMKKKVISHIATNGAGSIHDFEIAMIGETSEDVADTIEDGSFGMAEETGKLMNEAIKKGAQSNIGYGSSIGKAIYESTMPYKEKSIFYWAYKLGIPTSVHVAIGTDIIHQHPSCDGASLGKTTFEDFKIITDSVSKLEGGVVLNFGSSVILPEVFLKAITIARNLGFTVKKFTAANFDMIMHYRPRVNVVIRPTSMGGHGYNIAGQHEIMIPLLAKYVLKGD